MISAILLAEGVVVGEAQVLLRADPVLDDIVCGCVYHCLVRLPATGIRAVSSVRGYDLKIKVKLWF